MKAFNSILSKMLIISTTLLVTISIAIFPFFNWGLPLKNNIAVIITLIANQDPNNSALYEQLINSANTITGYTIGGLLLFNLTYLIPLIFVRRPFIKALVAIYMFLMTMILVVFILTIYNGFNIKNFQTIHFNGWWIMPLIGVGLTMIFIFWYGLRNLWVNPRKETEQIVEQSLLSMVDEDSLTYEDLQTQLKVLKKQLKDVRIIKAKNK